MTAAPRKVLSLSDFDFVRSQDKDGDFMWKNLAQNAQGRVSRSNLTGAAHKTTSRRWFAALLWKAFPAKSEREVARRAAPVLDVSERQVINWLRCENDAGVSYVTAVLILAGAGAVLDPIRGRAA